MAQDPYGFKDATPDGPRSLGGGQASVAMWAGVASTMLASVGICFCYMPYLVALPVGAYAVYTGYRAMEGDGPDDTKGRSMALAGMLSGLLSTLISGAFVMFIAMYALIYIGVIVFVMIGAATGNMN